MSIIGQLKEKVTQYIDVNVRLLKINLIGKTASLLSFFLFALIGLFLFFCIILFAGMGIEEAMTDAGMSKTASFFITTGIYALLLVILVAVRKPITRSISNIFIQAMTEDDEEEGK
jgi:hypothetical protein